MLDQTKRALNARPSCPLRAFLGGEAAGGLLMAVALLAPCIAKPEARDNRASVVAATGWDMGDGCGMGLADHRVHGVRLKLRACLAEP